MENLLRQIPEGRATTFGDLARALGDVAAARWVAQTVRSGRLADDCPVHRAVMKSGEPGGNDGDAASQIQKLGREGILLENDRVVLETVGFADFESSAPLAVLKRHQDNVPAEVELSPFPQTPDEIAAVDLSYLDDGTAVACYALVETASGRLAWSATVHRRVLFPYVSGYLAYRELPILLDLIEHVERQRAVAEVVFVDGNGRLHPRRAGIASHFGVLANLRTVGVGKTLLCGKVDLSQVKPRQPQPILDGEDLLGMAVKAGPKSKPVFVSPGHRIDVSDAVRLADRLFHGHRLPEPIFHADSLSRKEAKAIMSGADRAGDPWPPIPQSP